jgi:hypothetical protein
MKIQEIASRVVAETQAQFAPDPRLSVFDVEVRVNEAERRVLARGCVSDPVAAEALHHRLAGLDGGWQVEDRVTRLPEVHDPSPKHAIVSSAIAPMLAGPMVEMPLVSQLPLGHSLGILRREGRWLQCRSADGYLGWVHRGYLVQLSETEARGWEAGAGGELCIAFEGRVRDSAGELLVRLPWGARVLSEGGGRVRLPDGRHGRAAGRMIPLSQLQRKYPRDPVCATRTAAEWLGSPYLWSGVTPCGVDCSGYVQALFGLHGIALPRDSDLQVRTGTPVEARSGFENLVPGDLLFFAENRTEVTHVALSLGGSRIIHSSLGNGGVARNDLNGSQSYELELASRFVGARRYE